MKTLLTGFSKYRLAGFLARVQGIGTALNGAAGVANFPGPWPAIYPALATVTAAIADFVTKHGEAEDGDAGKIGARDASRAVLTELLQKLAPYLEAVADGDVAMLESTGYELSHDAVPAAPGELPAPQDVKLKHGNVSGSLLLGSGAVKGAGAYESRLGTDPNNEASFTFEQTTSGCRRVTFAGVSPGVLYYGQIRAIGPTGPGAWSDVAQLRAL